MKNKLAVIGRIAEIVPIEDADMIVSAIVVCGSAGKWQGVVKKGLHQIGELVRVFLPDAILPKTEEFAFMTDSHIRIRRFKGSLSECLIMPLEIGKDISEQEGVTKFERLMPTGLGGDIVKTGGFPTWLVDKTDEININSASQEALYAIGSDELSITLKMDGTSATYTYDTETKVFGMFSRNHPVRGGVYATAALGLEAKMIDMCERRGWATCVIQGEVCGSKLNGNTSGENKYKLYVFNLFSFTAGGKRTQYDVYKMYDMLREYDIACVPILQVPDNMQNRVNALKAIAESAVYANGRAAEGIVVRSLYNPDFSVKVMNPIYKR